MEADFNPFKVSYDKKATLTMVESGDATVEGTAFAPDNQNEGGLKEMAVLTSIKNNMRPKELKLY